MTRGRLGQTVKLCDGLVGRQWVTESKLAFQSARQMYEGLHWHVLPKNRIFLGLASFPRRA